MRNPVIYSCFWLVGRHQQGVAHLPSGVTELYRTCTCNFLCFEQHPMYMFIVSNVILCTHTILVFTLYKYRYIHVQCISLTMVALSI